jgi:hypothetical protein
MDLKDIEWDMDWTHLASDRNKWPTVVNTEMKLRIFP